MMKQFRILLAIMVVSIATLGMPVHSTSALVPLSQAVAKAPAEGEGPKVIIDAPDKVDIGDVIVVDLSGSIGGGFDFQVIPQPKQVLVDSNGKRIYCSTGKVATEYRFIVSCAVGDKSDVETKVVTVAGPPEQPSEPGDNFVAKVSGWIDLVESPEIRDDALKLSQSFSSVATLIESGMFQETSEIIEATAKSNQDALGSNLENWVPFLDALMVELTAMDVNGKLPTVESHAKVWRNVAAALKQFAAEEASALKG